MEDSKGAVQLQFADWSTCHSRPHFSNPFYYKRRTIGILWFARLSSRAERRTFQVDGEIVMKGRRWLRQLVCAETGTGANSCSLRLITPLLVGISCSSSSAD